jgi:ribosome biogenesis GTPase A
MKVDLEAQAEKGRTGRKIRAMILGIPNVGKSSFINRIAKRSTAGVGNKPGVTKQKQWIRINEKIELLDTPGVLWPKFESEEVALNLCFIGSIKEEILDKLEIAYQLTKFLLENYRKNLCERYKLEEEYIEKVLNQDQPENSNIYEIMLQIGKNRGCIMSGGRVDEEKTARMILDEFKNGKLGKVTIECPIL